MSAVIPIYDLTIPSQSIQVEHGRTPEQFPQSVAAALR